ncbi:hypothetical protein SAMN04489760_102120 [Syntrophus gentianae]|uniref:Uncharacterized protein n=1 Tax=Syntrophus gentianae TaxID=43775 RepID=A0A1H7UUR8_9BACT|nr:hypothetical protein [Syntrophus gentianae]SEM00713.1 hypothetical protein SAMN04489760_102120 [Syntrophus gentianae]
MNKGKKFGILAAVVVVLCGALYLGGLWQGRSQVNAEKEKCRQQLKDSDARRIAAENQVHFFKARTALFQTALDLDQRNFGLANAHLREADDPLARLNAAGMGMDKAQLDALRREIANTNIQVAIDLEVQRNLILNFERRLDSLIPRPTSPAVLPPAAVPPPPPPAAPQPAAPASPAKP